MTSSRYASVNGFAACFHNSILLWREARRDGWLIAIGVVSHGIGVPHVHAWLERGDQVYGVSSDQFWSRLTFYRHAGIDPSTVRLVNPRKFARHGAIDRQMIFALLDAWGSPWTVLSGGIVPK